MKNSEVTFTYSGVMTKNNRKWICVRFERDKDYAEGRIPECKIEKQEGFSAEEISQMEAYLVAEKENIMVEAKKLNNIKYVMGR